MLIELCLKNCEFLNKIGPVVLKISRVVLLASAALHISGTLWLCYALYGHLDCVSICFGFYRGKKTFFGFLE